MNQRRLVCGKIVKDWRKQSSAGVGGGDLEYCGKRGILDYRTRPHLPRKIDVELSFYVRQTDTHTHTHTHTESRRKDKKKKKRGGVGGKTKLRENADVTSDCKEGGRRGQGVFGVEWWSCNLKHQPQKPPKLQFNHFIYIHWIYFCCCCCCWWWCCYLHQIQSLLIE